jgi:transcription initiation factor TFIID subunit 6
VQPRIVQNPTPHELLAQDTRVATVHPVDKDAPKVKEILTKELQLYYEHIIDNIMKPDPKTRTLAIESVASDPGIQGLMPYFVQFITETVTKNLKNLDVTWVQSPNSGNDAVRKSTAHKPRYILRTICTHT